MATLRHLLAASVLGTAAVRAQEPVQSTAATQPGQGRITLREQLRWTEAEGDQREALLSSSLFVGLRHDLALGLEMPVRWLDTPSGDESGCGDVRLLGKLRVHRADTGPLDTERISVLAGVQFDTGEGPSLTPGFARGANDAIAGAAYTRIAGRHGVNAALVATLATDGGDDEVRADGAWLYRVSPATFTGETTAAVYAAAELTARGETNGDAELLLAPGLLYEARRWTAEFSLQLPLLQDVEQRPEIDATIVVGMRFLF